MEKIPAGGIVTPNGKTITLKESQKMFDLGEIIERHGTWAVTDYGVECLSTYYPIAASRLGKGLAEHAHYTWERHLRSKVWVIQGDLRAALDAGRRIHAERWRPAGDHA
jgi:hypothetical protein